HPRIPFQKVAGEVVACIDRVVGMTDMNIQTNGFDSTPKVLDALKAIIGHRTARFAGEEPNLSMSQVPEILQGQLGPSAEVGADEIIDYAGMAPVHENQGGPG